MLLTPAVQRFVVVTVVVVPDLGLVAPLASSCVHVACFTVSRHCLIRPNGACATASGVADSTSYAPGCATTTFDSATSILQADGCGEGTHVLMLTPAADANAGADVVFGDKDSSSGSDGVFGLSKFSVGVVGGCAVVGIAALAAAVVVTRRRRNSNKSRYGFHA